MSKAQAELQTMAVEAPSPQRLFETMTSYQHTAGVKAAIQLDLFTEIGDVQNTAASLAKRIKGLERGVRILCDCLVVLGFLAKTADRYSLNADSAVFLDRKCPAYAGSMKNFLFSDCRVHSLAPAPFTAIVAAKA